VDECVMECCVGEEGVGEWCNIVEVSFEKV
jgi:hypothetical protein